jgi:hypothetical protein
MQRKHLYAGLIIGALIVFLTSSLIVNKRLSDLRSTLDKEISADIEYLINMTPVAASGNDNQIINLLVRSCSLADNSDYEMLLGGLDNGLNASALNKLEQLFKLCGHVTASKRAGMVYLLGERLSNLNQLIKRREQLAGFTKEKELNIDGWNALVNKEKEISELFLGLVDVQGKIINDLINNVAIKELSAVQVEAQEIKAKLTVATEEASTLRATLVSS